MVATFAYAGTGDVQQSIIGLPPTRFYSLDEIGGVSRGAKLGFDALGRLAVIDEGSYVVLNDNAWIDLIEKQYHGDTPIQVGLDVSAGAAYYYGAVGSWGALEPRPDGKLHPSSLCPTNPPPWVRGTNFDHILPVIGGIYFAGTNGVVYWNQSSRTCHFHEIANTSIFLVGDKVYVYSREEGFFEIGINALTPIKTTGLNFLPGEAVEKTVRLDKDRVVITTSYNRLMAFDGSTLAPWATDAPWATTIPWSSDTENVLAEKITAIENLDGGDIAVAVRKRGLFILSSNGQLLRSLISPEYEDINDVAAREPGILWISTYRGIEKVYYGSPVSIVDQRISVVGTWPLVVSRGSKTLIAASGRLYEPTAAPQPRATVSFHPVPGFGSDWAQTIAASGSTLIVGNTQGAFAVTETSPHEQILHDLDVDKLSMLTPDICLAIGSKQITALRYENGHWAEGFDRIPGHGFAYLTYRAKNSVWVEYGVNRVARISIRAGKLHSQIIETFPWNEPRWINIGIIDNYVVLTGPLNGRAFFDEDTETFCEAPDIQSILQQSPYWISRVAKDNSGTIWGSHEQGVVKFIKTENGYTCDRTTMELVRDRHPTLQVVNGNDVWLSTGTVLYHVDGNSQYTKPPEERPVLASVHDVRTGIQILGAEPEASLHRLPYSQNSLNFRFFAGSYRLQIPIYEFRMNEKSSNWSVLGSDSLLTLPNLREGSYQFEVRLADSRGPVGVPLTIKFAIAPPWYRTWLALFAYITISAAIIASLVAWFGYRARLRNMALEKLIGERTETLRLTMEKLHEETRNAATLEERGRLANEIHDSVQQGLSGLILQLDSTLKFSALDKEARSRIDVARKMVAFTREEVRHAVWDMESPLLEHTELGDALKRMSMVVSSGTAQIDIQIREEPAPLTQSTKHHLLRIAQEAMTNAVRYSKAENIRVELACNEDHFSLSVIDNGIGFQIDSVPINGMGHFGLRSIRTRAKKIGGDLMIHSEPNHGTSVVVTLPITRIASTPLNADSKQG